MQSQVTLRVARALLVAVAGAVCVGPVAKAQAPPAPADKTGLASRANPASQHCVDKGGRVTIEKNGKDGQFGVCTFADNLQCEEWAMVRGDCQAGGIKVTGFVTPASRYCAITGGAYTVTSNSNAGDERGACRFKDGGVCDAAAYFDGTCARAANSVVAAGGNARAQPAPVSKAIRAQFACDGKKTIGAVFINGEQSSVSLTLSDGRKLSLPQAMSGSGARYASSNDAFVFWNKGNAAFIEENGKVTYTGCTTGR